MMVTDHSSQQVNAASWPMFGDNPGSGFVQSSYIYPYYAMPLGTPQYSFEWEKNGSRYKVTFPAYYELMAFIENHHPQALKDK